MKIEAFLDYLRLEKNYSLRTIKEYGEDLKNFESFFLSIDNDLKWETIDADIIRDWLEMMMDKGNAATSVNRRLSSLKSFYRWALSRNLISSNPTHVISGPKKEKPLPIYLREAEIDALLDEKLMKEDSYVCSRARTIIMMFYETGLRVSELVGLNDSDIDFSACLLKVLGKRNKHRIVPFEKELFNALKQYIKRRDEEIEKLSPALFLSVKGQRLTTFQVRKDVSKWISMVSTIKKRSPHVLRHTFATAMLNHGANLESVKKLLGHESLTTTEIYTHTTFEQLKKVYKSAHPREFK